MTRLAVALALLIAAAGPSLAVDSPAAPDFSWGVSCSSPVRASLEQARAKWEQAAAVPTAPQCLRSSSTAFDEGYLREVLCREDSACDLLDVGMAKLKAVEECRAAYRKAVALAGKRAPANAREFDGSYYLLKSRIRLAIGIARAQIARQMTSKDKTGYCFHAMEAAIDALRDAASDAARVPEGAARTEKIRKFRAALFSAWEAAENSKDTSVIHNLDLRSAWDSAGLGGQTQSRL